MSLTNTQQVRSSKSVTSWRPTYVTGKLNGGTGVMDFDLNIVKIIRFLFDVLSDKSPVWLAEF